jgi:hypothetical protein
MCLFGIATSKEFEIQIEQATEGFQSSNYRNSSPRIWLVESRVACEGYAFSRDLVLFERQITIRR